VGEHVRAFHSAQHDVRQAVAVDIRDGNLPADAGIAVGQVGNPVHAPLAALQAKPVNDRAGVPHRALLVVRVIRASGDDVLQPVAVHVHQVQRVQFAEQHAILVLRRMRSHDEVLLELDFVAVFHLLVPGETVIVSGEAGDDIVIAVAIDVVGVHLGAAVGIGE
jgi:hypothetical protein